MGGRREPETPKALVMRDDVTKTLPKEDDPGSCAECIGVSRPWRLGHLHGRC